jgi:hypothetical protein
MMLAEGNDITFDGPKLPSAVGFRAIGDAQD